MANLVDHWEITGKDGAALQSFYGDLFGWTYDTNNPMNYGIVGDREAGDSITGGVGQTPDGSDGMVTFYIGVDDVGAFLEKATSLGGTVFMPETEVMENVVIGLFADPEGHVIGLSNSIRS